jgi:hypothetical protein
MAGVRVLVCASAAALLVGGVVVGGRAAAAPDSQSSVSLRAAKLPSHLVGSWTRYVTAADWARAGVTTEPPHRFSMYVPADGSVAVAEMYVRFSPLSGNRLAISGRFPVCGKSRGIYRWTVSGRHLTLTKLQDSCGDAVGLWVGVWTRE